MANRFCGNCGTEVDDDAAFCPSCGQPIPAFEGDDATAAIPAAPAWPERSQPSDVSPAPPAGEPEQMPEPPQTASPAAPTSSGVLGWNRDAQAADAAPPRQAFETAPGPRPAPPPVAAGAAPSAAPPSGPGMDAPPPGGPPPGGPPPGGPPGAARGRSTGPQVELPITWPVTLSGWLIGGGAFVAAVGFLADMFGFRGGNAVNIIFLLLMLGVAATVFVSASLPAIPHLRLATLCVSFLALGIALDRLGFSIAGFGTLLVLLGTAAAAAGAVILELGRGPADGRAGGPALTSAARAAIGA